MKDTVKRLKYLREGIGVSQEKLAKMHKKEECKNGKTQKNRKDYSHLLGFDDYRICDIPCKCRIQARAT